MNSDINNTNKDYVFVSGMREKRKMLKKKKRKKNIKQKIKMFEFYSILNTFYVGQKDEEET